MCGRFGNQVYKLWIDIDIFGSAGANYYSFSVIAKPAHRGICMYIEYISDTLSRCIALQ